MEQGESMLKILIADDEKKVGLLVRGLIAWEELDLELLDIVQDGRTAYEIIVEKRPDIVITDIRMPGLSGLEMIRKVTEQGLHVHFIVISGYRYFEYAHTALKYGVKDYLLKPIDEVELNSILKKVCGEAKEKRNLLDKVETLEQNLESSRHMLHRELMERAFEQGEDHETDVTVVAETKDQETGSFRAAGIKVDRNIDIAGNEEQERLIVGKLLEMVDAFLKDQVNDLVISTKSGMWIIVLINIQKENRNHILTVLEQMFFKMKSYINNFENYEITMGLSRETEEFSRINLILEMAKEAVECRILKGCGICIESYSEDRNRTVKGQDIVKEYESALKNSIQIFNIGGLEDIVRECFLKAEQERVMACEYYEMGRCLAVAYARLAGELSRETAEGELNIWKETIGHCKSIYMLKRYLRESLKNHLKDLERKQSELERKPILDTIEYMRQNYGQKILLEDIAERFGFHPNYFSEIFKKETGKNFTAFLLEVRIEASKELLRDSNKTIYEIASSVGYKDAKFFSQQFAKVVGIKPKEYRKLYY
ncbi:response regulator [bacterium C-53]|nr:response regulator [Lachnospiraceae bacterium]NBI04058.1 response regulator [Lachnospiraceae bacterium]RKJ08832.1 response regulator [bacterium C-53]